ncbi:MAG: hypothetical protein J6K43_04875 [Lachnospiraceae bacterium]|nr:hypothetical protein [Lachnospiraceae bacterium]
MEGECTAKGSNAGTKAQQKSEKKVIKLTLLLAILWMIIVLLPLFTWILFGKNRIRINWAIHQMEKRYGEEFTFKRSVTFLEAPDGLEFYVEADDYPNRLIRVQVKWIKGKQVVTDGFLGMKFERETREFLEKTLEEALDAEVHVEYYGNLSDSAMPEGASGDMTFEEYIQLSSSKVRFYAITAYQCNDEEERAEIERIVEEAFVNNGICCTDRRIYFDDGNGYFEEMTNREIIPGLYLIKKYYSCEFNFEMVDMTGFSESEWEDSSTEE